MRWRCTIQSRHLANDTKPTACEAHAMVSVQSRMFVASLLAHSSPLCTYVHAWIHIPAQLLMQRCMHMYNYTCMETCILLNWCTDTDICTQTHACLHMYLHVCLPHMYIYTCMDTHVCKVTDARGCLCVCAGGQGHQ